MDTLEHARIGIDIGRVVICPTDELRGPDTSFLTDSPEHAMETPPAPDAADVIRALVWRTGGRVWFVSKAGTRIRRLTRAWFVHNDFHARTGVPPDRVRFCAKRHEKRGIAAELRLTHFVDDRADVLEPMRGVVDNLILFGVQRTAAPGWVTPARDWAAIRELLLRGVRECDERDRDPGGQPHAVR